MMTKEEMIEFTCPMVYEPHPEILVDGLDTSPDPMDFRKAGKIFKYYKAFARLHAIERYKEEMNYYWPELSDEERKMAQTRLDDVLIADYNQFMLDNFNDSETDE